MGLIKDHKNDCKKATFLIEKQQESSLTVKEEIKLRFHLYGCSWCRIYQQQSKNMHGVIIKLFKGTLSESKTLQNQYKNELKTLITIKLNDK